MATYGTNQPDFQVESHVVDSLRRKAVLNSAVDYKKRLREFVACRQKCMLGSYCNDVPLPEAELDLDKGEISFEEKPYVNEFFVPYAHAQYLAQTRMDCEAEARAYGDTMLDYMPSLSGRTERLDLVGPLPFWLFKQKNFVQAYTLQVRRHCKQLGLDVDFEASLPGNHRESPFRDHISRLWYHHRRALHDAIRRSWNE